MRTHLMYNAAKEQQEYESSNMDCDVNETFQKQALLVRQPDENFDPTIVPQTGEEFLMKMLYERQHCPAVVTKVPEKMIQSVKHNSGTTYIPMEMNEPEELSECTLSELLPTEEWKMLQLQEFLSIREQINRLRLQLDVEKYTSELEAPLTSEPAQWLTFCRQHEPLLSIIMHFSQRTLEQLLDMLCDWLNEVLEPEAPEPENASVEEKVEQISTSDKFQESSAETTTVQMQEEANVAAYDNRSAAAASTARLDLNDSQQRWLGAWFYATMACLHLPLEPDVHSTLRNIARTAIRLRAHLTADDQKSAAVPYNLFIHLIAKFFGQLDFERYV